MILAESSYCLDTELQLINLGRYYDYWLCNPSAAYSNSGHHSWQMLKVSVHRCFDHLASADKAADAPEPGRCRAA